MTAPKARLVSHRHDRSRTALTRRAVLLGPALAALAAHRPARAELVNFCVVGRNGWLFPVWDQVRHADFDRLHAVTGVVGEAVSLLRAAHIATCLVVIPAKSRVYRDFLPDDYRMSADAERRYGAVLAELARGDTIVPDLAALFAALRQAQPQADLFFRADSHWMTPASEAAAMECARQIREKAGLPPSARPGVTLGPPKSILQARNDLAALLPPAQQVKYPPQRYDLRPPLAGDAEDSLLGEDSADVVVIGNSFMQPNYGFSDMLSNRLGRPVALNWKVHQFSPYWMMLAFLRSERFRQRPRLIIWTFHEADMETPADNSGAWGLNAMAPSTFLAEFRRALGT